LFVLTGEAERLFVDRVALKIRELPRVVRVSKSCEHGAGAQMEVGGGDCGGDSDHQNDSRNKFFRVPQ
jgi:hypothetical protein